MNINKTEISKNIVIKWGLRKTFSKYIKSLAKTYSKFCIITDRNVEKLYAKKILEDLKKKKIDILCFSVPAGESSKSRNVKAHIEDALIDHGFGRDSAIIAIGGGVIGDLSGFIASTFCRGIGFIQIPTTLLAMVDSSVGGKNGISLPKAKNMVGTIYHPDIILTDPEFILSLPKKEYLNGLAEIIKTALILDKDLFDFLEKNREKILKTDKKMLSFIVEKCATLKNNIVKKDPNENELRKILNYGHTIGHAIETISNYKMTHGECIAIGMKYAADLAVNMKIMSIKDCKRQNDLLLKYGFNLNLPKNIEIKNIIQNMKNDKKNKSGKIHFVLIDKIGHIFSKNNNVTLAPSDKHLKEILK